MPDTTELLISRAFLNTTPVTDLAHGTVIISEIEPPTAVVSYDDTENRFADTLLITATFSEAMSAAAPVRIRLSGAASLADTAMARISENVYTYRYQIPKASGEVFVSLSNGTDLWGNGLISEPLAGGSFSIIGFIPGDVNDDSVIQAYDAALALQYSVGMDPLPEQDPMPWAPWRDSTANVDGTGGITANDAGLILQFSAGIITSFPSETVTKAATAGVRIALENDHLVFHSHGQLLGLNINTSNEEGILGNPEILNRSYMYALNVADAKYRIGLCTAVPVPDEDAFLKIPVLKSGSVNFHLIENAVEREVTLDVLTSMKGFLPDELEIFPNPVKDLLQIRGINGPAMIRISSIHGQEVRSIPAKGGSVELNLSDLPEGLYLLTIELESEQVTRRFIKK